MHIKTALLSIPFITCIQSLYANDADARPKNKTIDHSHFTVRPQFEIGSPEYIAATRTYCLHRDDLHVSFAATVFGGRSTKPNTLGSYFMPFGTASASVNGKIKENGTDLLTQSFNLFSVEFSNVEAMMLPEGVANISKAFASEIAIAPRQSVGIGLTFDAHFSICDHTWFVKCVAPLIHVQNTMNLSERIIEQGEFYSVQPIEDSTTNLNMTLTNMKQALTQNDWQFGKINCDTLSETRFAFVQALVGIQFIDTDMCHAKSALGISIPTGNQSCEEFVFEPVVGHEKHFGLIWNTEFGTHIWHYKNYCHTISFETDITLQYLCAKTETRSMNIKNKPWSRYMELYENKEQALQAQALQTSLAGVFLATPGINVLTRDIKLQPGFNVTANLAFVYTNNPDDHGFNAEIGYNVYARQAEKISLKKCSAFGKAAIKDCIGKGITNPVRDMTNNQLSNEASLLNIMTYEKTDTDIIADYDTHAITVNDLDLSSAAHPCVIAQTVYSTFGYHWDEIRCPVTCSLGGSYEFAGRDTTVLNRWLLWGTIGISF